jgi:hypothetical protein
MKTVNGFTVKKHDTLLDAPFPGRLPAGSSLPFTAAGKNVMNPGGCH